MLNLVKISKILYAKILTNGKLIKEGKMLLAIDDIACGRE